MPAKNPSPIHLNAKTLSSSQPEAKGPPNERQPDEAESKSAPRAALSNTKENAA